MTIRIVAVMQDGTRLEETAADLEQFADLVYPLRHDPDCRHLAWSVQRGPARRAAAAESARAME